MNRREVIKGLVVAIPALAVISPVEANAQQEAAGITKALTAGLTNITLPSDWRWVWHWNNDPLLPIPVENTYKLTFLAAMHGPSKWVGPSRFDHQIPVVSVEFADPFTVGLSARQAYRAGADAARDMVAVAQGIISPPPGIAFKVVRESGNVPMPETKYRYPQ